MRFLRVSIAAGSICALFGAAFATLRYPATPVRPVVNVYSGTRVSDPYQWLENGKDPQVSVWARAQTAIAQKYIGSQIPYAFYRRRIAELAKTGPRRSLFKIVAGRYFYTRFTPPEPQPELIARDGLTGTERVLFDPNAFVKTGAPPAFESVFPAPDGSKLAFTTQQSGSEEETLRVVDASTGKLLPDTIDHAGGGTSPTAVVWDADGSGFIHTRWPLQGNEMQRHLNIRFYHHVLGTDPSTDTYVFGEGQPATAEYNVAQSADGTVAALSVAAGDGVHNAIYVRRGAGDFDKVASPDDGIGDSANLGGGFVGGALYVISSKRNRKGELVAIGPGQTFATGKTILSENQYVLEALFEVQGGFITRELNGGDSVARYFSAAGNRLATLPIPVASTLDGAISDPRGGDIIVQYVSYDTPGRWLRYDAAHNALLPTGIENKVPGDYSRVSVKRVFAPSLDGTAKIPLEIIALRSTRLGHTTPTILTAYGSYGVVSRPSFIGPVLAWLERGGVLAHAMIRGGGEYGEDWHTAAVHTTVYKRADDLAACAKWLAANGYGDRRHLGIQGGSAGGFLMGMALTRNPDRYRAVEAAVGIYDIRWVDTPNGRYNIPEFGNPLDPKQFAWMYRYFPYYNVHTAVKYPAILMTTGENDPRVDPGESRKMVARLQAASSSGYPILLWQKAAQGHGIGNSFRQRLADAEAGMTFFESQLR